MLESEKWWNIGVGEMVEHGNVGVGEMVEHSNVGVGQMVEHWSQRNGGT